MFASAIGIVEASLREEGGASGGFRGNHSWYLKFYHERLASHSLMGKYEMTSPMLAVNPALFSLVKLVVLVCHTVLYLFVH